MFVHFQPMSDKTTRSIFSSSCKLLSVCREKIVIMVDLHKTILSINAISHKMHKLHAQFKHIFVRIFSFFFLSFFLNTFHDKLMNGYEMFMWSLKKCREIEKKFLEIDKLFLFFDCVFSLKHFYNFYIVNMIECCGMDEMRFGFVSTHFNTSKQTSVTLFSSDTPQHSK